VKNIRVTILAVLAMAATVGVLWLTNNSVTPREATWADVVAEAESGGYRLISTDELWQRYSRTPKSLLLVDTRQEWEYRTGHIRGRSTFPWSRPGSRGGAKKRNCKRYLVKTGIDSSFSTERA
jgi:hypothetical protein